VAAPPERATPAWRSSAVTALLRCSAEITALLEA